MEHYCKSKSNLSRCYWNEAWCEFNDGEYPNYALCESDTYNKKSLVMCIDEYCVSVNFCPFCGFNPTQNSQID